VTAAVQQRRAGALPVELLKQLRGIEIRTRRLANEQLSGTYRGRRDPLFEATLEKRSSVRSQALEFRDSTELSYDVFVRDYMATNRPVVVRNRSPAMTI